MECLLQTFYHRDGSTELTKLTEHTEKKTTLDET